MFEDRTELRKIRANPTTTVLWRNASRKVVAQARRTCDFAKFRYYYLKCLKKRGIVRSEKPDTRGWTGNQISTYRAATTTTCFCRPTRRANPPHRIESGENSYGNWLRQLSSSVRLVTWSAIEIICPGHSMFSVVKVILVRNFACEKKIRNTDSILACEKCRNL